MGDIRDPERDQRLPKLGRLPVQEIMIQAIGERREYGIRKYGRPLETHNGRDALKDAWEEALDLFTYLTQVRLERGDVLPGMKTQTVGMDLVAEMLDELIPSTCPECRHEPHTLGACTALAGPSLGMLCPCGSR